MGTRRRTAPRRRVARRPQRTPIRAIDRAAFALAYLETRSASLAYQRVVNGVTPETAKVMGRRYLSEPGVMEAILEQGARVQEKAELSVTRLLEEYRRIAFSDLSQAFDPVTRRLLPLHRMPPEIRAAVASVKVLRTNLIAGDGQSEEVYEIKLWSKTEAMRDLAKHFGLLREVVELVSSDEINRRIDEGRRRARELAQEYGLIDVTPVRRELVGGEPTSGTRPDVGKGGR